VTQHLFEKEIHYSVCFNQLNASLLNKSIHFLWTPNFWMMMHIMFSSCISYIVHLYV